VAVTLPVHIVTELEQFIPLVRRQDLVFSVLFLLTFSPLLLVIAVCIKCEDGGSVIYRQKDLFTARLEISIPKWLQKKTGES